MRKISRSTTAIGVAAFLALAFSSAACRPTAVPQVPATPTVAPFAAPTPTPIPWILVGADVSPEVQEAVSAWGEVRGLEVRVEPIDGQPQIVPPGLQAVVGMEPGIRGVHDRWAAAGTVIVVVNPVSLGPGEKTSVLGPTVSYDHAGFLAGIAAGLATSSGGVGLTPGRGGAAATFALGFEEGVRYACPKCRVEQVPVPARPPFGVDVVGLGPDPEPLGDEQVGGAPWLIVTGNTELGGWGDRLTARVRESPETIVGPAIERLLDGSPGEAWAYTAENGGLRVEVVDGRAISPGRQRLLREAEARLASGLLLIGGGE